MAFMDNKIKRIVIPNSVTNFDGAFKNCGIEELTIPDNVVKLTDTTAGKERWQGNKLNLLIWRNPSTTATDTVLSTLTYASENGTGQITIRTTKTEFVYNLIENSTTMEFDQKRQYIVTDMQGEAYSPIV